MRAPQLTLLSVTCCLLLACATTSKTSALCQDRDDCGACYEGQCVVLCSQVCPDGERCVESGGLSRCVDAEELFIRDTPPEQPTVSETPTSPIGSESLQLDVRSSHQPYTVKEPTFDGVDP